MAICTIWGAFQALHAQQFRSPSELAAIARNSQLDYTIDLSREALPLPEHTALTDSRTYQVATGEGYEIARYELEAETEAIHEQAEKAYAAKDYPGAIVHYRAMLDRQPDLAFVMTLIGECYGRLEKTDSALIWWQKAAEENFFDYLPHWFLANEYVERKEKEKAVREATLAWTLNRNHPRLGPSARTILDRCGIPISDFRFQPQILIEKKGSRVALLTGEEWASYALCKAVWAHEPGSAHSGEFDLNEETECLLNLQATWAVEAGKKFKKSFVYRILNRSVEEHWLSEFIFFELWLPREPYIVYTQPREGIEAIARYIVEVRKDGK